MGRLSVMFLIYCLHPFFAVSEGNFNFDETIRQAPLIQQQALKSAQGVNVQTLVNEGVPDSQDPNQLNAMKNEWNSGGAHLKQKAVTESQESTVGRAVMESAIHNAGFTINANDPDIRNSNYIANHADRFLEGQTNAEGDCEKMNICRTQYETRLCEATHQEERFCSSHPVVSFKTHSVFRREHFSGNLMKRSSNAWVFMARASGKIKSAFVQLSGSENPFWCKTTYHGYLDGQLLGEFRLPCGGGMGEIRFQNGSLDIAVKTGQEIVFTFDQGVIERYVGRAIYEIDVEIEEIVAEPIISWEEQCVSPIVSYCEKKEEICIKPGDTQRFPFPGTNQTLDVTLDCLEKSTTYLCGLHQEGCFEEERRVSATDDTCTLSSTTCISSEQGLCLREKRSYLCARKNCDSVSMVCGAKIFCFNGDCVEGQDPSFDSDELKKDLTDLAALSEASKGVNEEGRVNIFGGEALSCGGDGLGYSKCCEDRGWGHDLGLSRCSADEKRLGLAREKGWTISLGTHCVADTPFGCLREKQVFCVFQNKLSRIVQEHGRVQIGLSFGSAESPDCRGLSMSEIESIRFDSMPLESAFDDEIAPHVQLKNSSEIKDRIAAKLPSFQKGGYANGQ